MFNVGSKVFSFSRKKMENFVKKFKNTESAGFWESWLFLQNIVHGNESRRQYLKICFKLREKVLSSVKKQSDEIKSYDNQNRILGINVLSNLQKLTFSNILVIE